MTEREMTGLQRMLIYLAHAQRATRVSYIYMWHHMEIS